MSAAEQHTRASRSQLLPGWPAFGREARVFLGFLEASSLPDSSLPESQVSLLGSRLTRFSFASRHVIDPSSERAKALTKALRSTLAMVANKLVSGFLIVLVKGIRAATCSASGFSSTFAAKSRNPSQTR